MTDLFQLIQDKKNEIKAIASKHGAYNIRGFGSVARKNFTKDSDIDFLVNFNPKTSLLDWCSLRLDLEDLWRAISDMRNVLAHQYFEVDHEKIELVVHGSLEDLKSTVIKMLL